MMEATGVHKMRGKQLTIVLDIFIAVVSPLYKLEKSAWPFLSRLHTSFPVCFHGLRELDFFSYYLEINLKLNEFLIKFI